MSNPNLDSRYAKPADVAAAISAQAVTDTGQYAPIDSALAYASDKIVYVSPNGNDTNNGLSWKKSFQTLNAAISALNTGGIIEVTGTYTVNSSLSQPSNNTLVRGRGPSTQISWTGSGTMLTLTNAKQVHFSNIRITATAAAQTLFLVSNSFRCSWDRCLIDGQHSSTTGSTYYGQVGFQFRNNSGDNRIINCDLNNFGEAIQADTIQNYLVGSVVGNCYTGIHVDAGSSTGGFAIDMCTFVGTAIGAAYVRAHVLIDVAANSTWITNTWMEGCTTAVQAGSAASGGGPVGLTISNTRLAATSKCLDIQAGRQIRLDNVRFGYDANATPTELSINATYAVDGFASNLVSAQIFDFARSLFPTTWTYIPRYTSDAQIAGYNAFVGSNVASGTPSYVYTGGGRARIGYDGTKTVFTDAGGGRDVMLVSGTTARQAGMGADGVFYVGAKTQGAANAGGAVVAIAMQNAVTLPTTNPTSGGVLYINNGALTYRGSSGTVTILGPA